jgi:nitrogen fixation protein FixH
VYLLAVNKGFLMSDTRKKDKRIPYYFVLFFVVLAIVDGIFVYLATSTHTGVIKEQAYQKGVEYNRTIEAVEAQTELGWESSISYDGADLSFYVKSGDDVLDGAVVEAYFVRPTQAGYDFSVLLKRDEKGVYRRKVDFPLKGQWDANIVVRWNQKHYQQQKRLVVR